MWFDVFRFGFFAVFALLHCALWLGMFLERRREKKCATRDGEAPFVSVVIPLRNEENRVKPLLESLSHLDYPNYEIIFVDDASSDATPRLLADFAAKSVGGNASVLMLRENPGKNRKQYALGVGIAAAKGDIFLFTDADCVVRSEWIAVMAQRITAREGTGACLAPVLKVWNGERGSYFERYQCYDHAIRYLYLAGAAGIGQAGGGFGNNLAVKRAAMEAAGGYAAVPESATEDAALVSLIRAKTKFTVRAIYEKEAHVLTAGEKTWPAMLNQTLRWQIGGLFSPDPGTRVSYSFLMYMISAGALALPLLPFFPALWPLFVADLFVMLPNSIYAFAYLRASLPPFRADYILHAALTPLSFGLLTLASLFRVKFTWR